MCRRVVRVGQIAITVPETMGALTIDLTLTVDGREITNRYSTAVTLLPD